MGLLRPRQIWFPTWRGWGLLLLLAFALTLTTVKKIQPFLAVTAPIPAEALIVEGWQPDYALVEVIAEFQRKGYHKVYVTGGPLGQGSFLSEYKDYADLGAASLLRMGMKAGEVQAVPAPQVRQDRTYSSAIALKEWLQSHGVETTHFNLVTMDVHARRSWLLFQRAFGPGAKLGIISIPSRDYETDAWWHSSEGVRSVSGETIAYGYARTLFKPSAER